MRAAHESHSFLQSCTRARPSARPAKQPTQQTKQHKRRPRPPAARPTSSSASLDGAPSGLAASTRHCCISPSGRPRMESRYCRGGAGWSGTGAGGRAEAGGAGQSGQAVVGGRMSGQQRGLGHAAAEIRGSARTALAELCTRAALPSTWRAGADSHTLARAARSKQAARPHTQGRASLRRRLLARCAALEGPQQAAGARLGHKGQGAPAVSAPPR